MVDSRESILPSLRPFSQIPWVFVLMFRILICSWFVFHYSCSLSLYSHTCGCRYTNTVKRIFIGSAFFVCFLNTAKNLKSIARLHQMFFFFLFRDQFECLFFCGSQQNWQAARIKCKIWKNWENPKSANSRKD